MVANRGGKKVSSLPLPAIVGQDELKRALLALAVDDDLEGALIVGEKGTAKSTAVRSLVDLLPDQRVVADCPYGCVPDDRALQCSGCRERDPADLPVETRPVPLVTLPLGATRDRVVGTLSVADALAGEADFDPGLLARAHRGFLYVDEVNLLDDHLVDVLLDAAASGVNTVERDGVSVSHPTDLTLVGTMNPEEGGLRPQLRDRFALQVTVEGCRDVADRVEIIDRALGADGADPAAAYADEEARLRDTLRSAGDRRNRVSLPAEFKTEIARLCLDAEVDGHRGDIAIARTAKTLAALDGRSTAIESDVHEAASYALPHRLRSTPFADEADLDALLDDRFPDRSADDRTTDGGSPTDCGGESGTGDGDEGRSGDEKEPTAGDGRGPPKGDDGGSAADGAADRDPDSDAGGEARPDRHPTDADDRTEIERGSAGVGDPSGNASAEGANTSGFDSTASDEADDAGVGDGDEPGGDTADGDTGETAHPVAPGQRRESIADVGDAASPDFDSSADDERSRASADGSRASTTGAPTGRGARVRTEPATDGPIDAASSVRAAATRGSSRVTERDLRRPVRSGRTAATIVFAVDASASMRPAMRDAKGVVLDLLRESYERRDEVAFVAFAGEGAEVKLPPTDSVTLAARHLKSLPTGDRTPLPAGLETAHDLLAREDPVAAVVVLVTDGRANVADGSPTAATRTAARRLATRGADVLVVDASGDRRPGLIPAIAAETDAEVLPLSSLTLDRVRAAADGAAATDADG